MTSNCKFKTKSSVTEALSSAFAGQISEDQAARALLAGVARGTTVTPTLSTSDLEANDYFFWKGGAGGTKRGVYWIPQLLGTSAVRNTFEKYGAGIIRATHKGIGDKAVELLISCPLEIDDLEIEEQARKLDWLQSELGLDLALVIMSGDRRPESTIPSDWVGVTVERGKSLHAYFAIEPLYTSDTESLNLWREIQGLLISILDSDPAIRNPSRLMRYPGSFKWDGGAGRLQTPIVCNPVAHDPVKLRDALHDLWEREGCPEPAHVRRARERREGQLADAQGVVAMDWGAPAGDGGHGEVLDGGAFDPDELQVSDGAVTRTVTEWSSTGANKVICCCPFHDDATPSAALFLDGSRPVLWCSSCGTSWRGEALAPEVQAATAGVNGDQYMADVILQKPITALACDTSTGKTYQFERLARTTKRVLAIVHRRSLARALSARLGLANYEEEMERDITADRVVVCLDSLCRVDWRQPFDLVVLEESESLMDHLFSGGTIPRFSEARPDSGTIYAHLRSLCLTTVAAGGRVVAADAFWSRLSAEGLARLCDVPSKDIDVVEHRRDHTGFTVHSYASDADLLEKVVQWTRAGERVAVGCSTATDVRALEVALSQPRDDGSVPRPLAHWREMDQSLRESLGNVESAWADDGAVLLYSPTIDSGLSYARRDRPFDRVAFLGRFPQGGGSLPFGLNKIFQMADRIRQDGRKFWDLHVWIDEAWDHNQPTDRRRTEKSMLDAYARSRRTTIRAVGGDLVERPAEYDEEHWQAAVDTEAAKRVRARAVRASFLQYWRKRGATVNEGIEVIDDGQRELWRSFLKELKRAIKSMDAQDVLSARPLDDVEAMEIKRRGARDRGEALSLERARLLRMYGTLGLEHDQLHGDRYRQRTQTIRRLVTAGLLVGGHKERAFKWDRKALESGYKAALSQETTRITAAVAVVRILLSTPILRAMAVRTQMDVPEEMPDVLRRALESLEIGIDDDLEPPKGCHTPLFRVKPESWETRTRTSPSGVTHPPYTNILSKHGVCDTDEDPSPLDSVLWTELSPRYELDEMGLDDPRPALRKLHGQVDLGFLGWGKVPKARAPKPGAKKKTKKPEPGRVEPTPGYSLVKLLGEALRFLGIKTANKQVRRPSPDPDVDSSIRVRVYSLDLEAAAETLALAERHNRLRRGFEVPDLAEIDPVLAQMAPDVCSPRYDDEVLDDVANMLEAVG